MAFTIQWNVNGFYPRLNFIRLLLSEHTPIALCLQETNLKPLQKPHIRNYSGYFKNRFPQNIASGGVAIFVRDEYKVTDISSNYPGSCSSYDLLSYTNNYMQRIYSPRQEHCLKRYYTTNITATKTTCHTRRL